MTITTTSPISATRDTLRSVPWIDETLVSDMARALRPFARVPTTGGASLAFTQAGFSKHDISSYGAAAIVLEHTRRRAMAQPSHCPAILPRLTVRRPGVASFAGAATIKMRDAMKMQKTPLRTAINGVIYRLVELRARPVFRKTLDQDNADDLRALGALARNVAVAVDPIFEAVAYECGFDPIDFAAVVTGGLECELASAIAHAVDEAKEAEREGGNPNAEHRQGARELGVGR